MKVEPSENIRIVRFYLNQLNSFLNSTANKIVLQYGKMKLVPWCKKTIKILKMKKVMMIVMLLIAKSACKKSAIQQANNINFSLLLLIFFKLRRFP